jgi:hypothetical protein
MKKTIDHFVIRTYLKNGDVWETIRHTREGMNNVIKGLFDDEEVVRFSVEEKVAA